MGLEYKTSCWCFSGSKQKKPGEKGHIVVLHAAAFTFHWTVMNFPRRQRPLLTFPSLLKITNHLPHVLMLFCNFSSWGSSRSPRAVDRKFDVESIFIKVCPAESTWCLWISRVESCWLQAPVLLVTNQKALHLWWSAPLKAVGWSGDEIAASLTRSVLDFGKGNKNLDLYMKMSSRVRLIFGLLWAGNVVENDGGVRDVIVLLGVLGGDGECETVGGAVTISSEAILVQERGGVGRSGCQ